MNEDDTLGFRKRNHFNTICAAEITELDRRTSHLPPAAFLIKFSEFPKNWDGKGCFYNNFRHVLWRNKL